MRASQIDTGSTGSLSYGQRPDPQLFGQIDDCAEIDEMVVEEFWTDAFNLWLETSRTASSMGFGGNVEEIAEEEKAFIDSINQFSAANMHNSQTFEAISQANNMTSQIQQLTKQMESLAMAVNQKPPAQQGYVPQAPPPPPPQYYTPPPAMPTNNYGHSKVNTNTKVTADEEDVEDEDAVEDTPAVEEAEELDRVNIKGNKEILTKPQPMEDSTMDRTACPTQSSITRIGGIVGAMDTMWTMTVLTVPTPEPAASVMR
eukprot:scaffold160254_cov115-Cyclotella_meneghiniana.AAC.1